MGFRASIIVLLILVAACGDVAPTPAPTVDAGCPLDADDAQNCAICGMRCISIMDGGTQ